MRKRQWGLWLVAVLVGIGCANITINVYFPAEKIQEAADIIESQVRGMDKEKETEEEAQQQSSKALYPQGGIFDIFCSTAYAQEVENLKIQTPAIERVIKSRKERWPKVKDLLDKGVVGEGNTGFLVKREMQSLPLPEVAQANKLIREENADRKAQYEEIARANDLETDAGTIERIGKQFAKEIRRDQLSAGQFYQDEDGKWVQVQKK